MEKERLMELLRNPQKFQKKAERKAQAQKVKQDRAEKAAIKTAHHRNMKVIGAVIAVLVVLSLLFIFSAQRKAHNIMASLDPSVLKGLVVDATFNPNNKVTYIQISEGQDRNVTVTGVGASSTLPVISRYNYLAMTTNNYEVIGRAPWALSINVESNLGDPDLLRYLFNQEKVTESFVERKDVAPYLADPASLAALAKDEKKLAAFFAQEPVQKVLASPQLLHAIAGSRLISTLLISKAVKFYRDNPAEAVKIIQASPVLSELKKNPNIRKEIAANTYLKKISSTLLK